MMTLESVATGQNNDSVPGAIKAVPGTLEQGKPSQRFPDNYKSHDLVEVVLDDVYLDMRITATNEHATEHAEFQKNIGRTETNEKGRRAFFKGYFATGWHLSLSGYHQREWTWSTDTFKEHKKVKK